MALQKNGPSLGCSAAELWKQSGDEALEMDRIWCNLGAHKSRFFIAILLTQGREPKLCILLTSQEK